MNKQVAITYDTALQKLVIRCPYWANDLIKLIPSVRWNKTRKAWVAPVTRKNVEEIERHLSPHADVSPGAREWMDKSKTPPATEFIAGHFPFWYPFKREPAPYQQRAIDKAYPHDAFAIFADPGTGKTKMAIDLTCGWRMEDKIGCLLIITKRTLRYNWTLEIEKDAPIPMHIHIPETDKRKDYERWVEARHDFPVLIVGFESLSAGRMIEIVQHFLRTGYKPGIINDESTHIASPNAIVAERVVAMRTESIKRLALTGTPLRDNPLNVYMQFEYLDPNIIGIGDFYAFRNRYATLVAQIDKKSGKKFHKIVGYQNIEELVTTVAPYVFQITKEEAGLNLPAKRYQVRMIEWDKNQRAVYDRIRKEGAWDVDGEEQVISICLEEELRLHQVCGGFTVKARTFEKTVKGQVRIQKVFDPVPLFDDPLKIPKVRELMDILDEYKDNQIIVWCMYVPEIEAIQHAMAKRKMPAPALYYGAVKDEERNAYDDGFKTGKYRVMLANPQTGSMGLTWVSRNAVSVYYSNSNKLVDRVQSEDRQHRRGSTGDYALYIDLMMERSADVTRKAAIDDKKDLSDFFRARIAHAQKLLNGEVT